MSAIVIDDLRQRGASIAIEGSDWLGPRTLVVWRVQGPGLATPVARGSSTAGRSLSLPELPVPEDGALIAVAPEGSSPFGAEASSLQWLLPRIPVAPVAAIVMTTGGAREVRVSPRETHGSILLADAEHRVLREIRLPARWGAATAGVSIALATLPSAPESVAHQFPDGRRSDWTPIANR